jgi:hypothetical protein
MAPGKFLGVAARLNLEQSPYCYLVLEDVPVDEADSLAERARRCLTWAAVRLDMGIMTDSEPLKRSEYSTFDGQFATAIPLGVQARPTRIDGAARSEEPSTRLIAALTEGANRTKLDAGDKSTLLLACELFASVDFEATSNAQFLILTAVYEVLANPKKRPKPCVDLVEKLLDGARKSQETAAAQDDGEMEEAYKALCNSAAHLKKESITSSVRKLATRTSEVLGDTEPDKAGRRAASLYGKRSQLVHKGKSVSSADVCDLRTLVREAIAVEAGCFDHIRERYP